MRSIQRYQDQIQGLCVDLINKSIARTISVNESFCVYLSTTWTNCTINQKVLISKLTLFIHWCSCRQGRNSVTRSNSSSDTTECRDYLFFDSNTSGKIESKEICLSYICTRGLYQGTILEIRFYYKRFYKKRRDCKNPLTEIQYWWMSHALVTSRDWNSWLIPWH